MEHNSVEIGPVIKRLREEKGWNQTELAAYSHTSIATVSHIETGRRGASTRTLAKIADALGVDVADLFPKEDALLPLPEVDKRQFEDFRRHLSTLELDELRAVGRELRKELREAVKAKDVPKTAELYARLGMVGELEEEINPSLATVRIPREGPVTVDFHREPTQEELADLEKKYPGFIATMSPVTI